MKKVLVLCTGNSCRSQIAHGYLEFFAKSRLKIYSAGVEVHGVNQTAIDIMKEDNIDISNYSSNHVDEYLSIDFDYIITVCDHAKESCPLFDLKDAIKIHKNFFDPSKTDCKSSLFLENFRIVQSDIKFFCEDFINKLV
ncbi:arsenate reductase ArsC [Flavobacteriaceae bacterium]|nr:arsenate reductase ArsC [Flavobacteriaceae bacterium]MDC1491979.1 arsenate reductase ArsC [Flavobacteriaceae bacterium]MDC1534934.1 arsenate reductase ArsC [Flavobacteriaceae bacterium]